MSSRAARSHQAAPVPGSKFHRGFPGLSAGRVFQAAATVPSILRPGLLEKAARAGLRSLFVGFESLDAENLRTTRKQQNRSADYATAIRRAHEAGVMINGSFVFGMDQDDESVFDRTVAWAIENGIETSTYHIMTPYPGTALFARIEAANRIVTRDWDLYDTRHVVYRPARLQAERLQHGYWQAYRDFYRWSARRSSRGLAGRTSQHVLEILLDILAVLLVLDEIPDVLHHPAHHVGRHL